MTGWKRDACLPLACSWATPWTTAARTSGALPRPQRRRTPPRTRRRSSPGRRRGAGTPPPLTRRGRRPREGMQASSDLPAAASAHLKADGGTMLWLACSSQQCSSWGGMTLPQPDLLVHP